MQCIQLHSSLLQRHKLLITPSIAIRYCVCNIGYSSMSYISLFPSSSNGNHAIHIATRNRKVIERSYFSTSHKFWILPWHWFVTKHFVFYHFDNVLRDLYGWVSKTLEMIWSILILNFRRVVEGGSFGGFCCTCLTC